MDALALVELITDRIVKNKKFFSQQSLINLMNENDILDRVFFIRQLRKNLLEIADGEDSFWPNFSPQVYDAIELNLLNLAKYYPENKTTFIQDKNLFLTTAGYQLDLSFSGELIKVTRKNPTTNAFFNIRDEVEVSSLLQLPPRRNADWSTHGLAALGGAALGAVGGAFFFMVIAGVIFTLPVSWVFVGALVGVAIGVCASVALSGLIQDLRTTCCSPKPNNNKVSQLERLKNAEQQYLSRNNISVKHIDIPLASDAAVLKNRIAQPNIGVAETTKSTMLFSTLNPVSVPPVDSVFGLEGKVSQNRNC